MLCKERGRTLVGGSPLLVSLCLSWGKEAFLEKKVGVVDFYYEVEGSYQLLVLNCRLSKSTIKNFKNPLTKGKKCDRISRQRRRTRSSHRAARGEHRSNILKEAPKVCCPQMFSCGVLFARIFLPQNRAWRCI